MMNWEKLVDLNQIEHIRKVSGENPVIIYKHSTRCSTSHMVLDRLERNWKQEEMQEIKPFLLNLISFREISNAVAITFDVTHESPQLLVIKDGKSISNLSHFEIDYSSIVRAIKNI